MIQIDGSQGEGGGQILRSALALSMFTGQPFRIDHIRAKRSKPGLLRQHLTAVEAATKIGQAEVAGASIGSSRLDFRPGKLAPGAYRFSVGTAGSTTLVLQTVLPVLLTATEPTDLILEGGTHNTFAPPYDFLSRAFLPLINRMGPKVSVNLERSGFFPAGGGRFSVRVEPVAKLERIELPRRGEVKARRARALVSNLPRHVAARELGLVSGALRWKENELYAEEVESNGPGNILLLEIESEHVTEVFAGFGEKGRPSEEVARAAIEPAQRYLSADVAVGEFLADQLLLPMALAGGGSFSTHELSSHAQTNIEVIKLFLNTNVRVEKSGRHQVQVHVGN